MKTFSSLRFKSHQVVPNSKQAVLTFDNGFGVSVVGGGFGLYGNGITSWELAEIDKEGNIQDVHGWLSRNEVTAKMKEIQSK